MDDYREYVAAVTDYEKRTDYKVDRKTFSLDRMRSLVERIGRPDERFASLHVAGSNGKGTTSHLTAEILRQAGKRVGLYTSPHLARVNERIRIDGEPIPDAEWLGGMERLAPAFEASHPDGRPTFFEIVTALAFDAFARGGVDLAVLEVGLGGRLDATNVVDPAAVAITEISLEHTAQLGDTVEKIAAEKAAIIKEGVPVVSGVSDPRARAVIEARALAEAAPLFLYGSDLVVDPVELVPERGTRFHVRTWKRGYSSVYLPMPGSQFVRDAALALGLCEAAKERGLVDFGSAQLRPALARARVPGRCHLVETDPPVLLDGAHNPGAMAAVFATLREFFPSRRPVVLFGLLADKDVDSTLAAMAGARRFYVTRVESARTMGSAELAAAVRARRDVPVESGDDALALLDRARASLEPGEILLVTGSFYLVGQFLRDRYPEAT